MSDFEIESDDGDENSKTTYFELLEPVRHTGWGVQHVPSSSHLVIAHRWTGSHLYSPLTPEERIVDVDHHEKYLVVKIESTTENKFKYRVLIDCTSHAFSIEPFVNSIVNTLFESMKQETEKQWDEKYWTTKDGLPLRAKALATKLRNLMHVIDMKVVQNSNLSLRMRGTEVSRETESRSMSPGSIGRRTPSVGRASRAKPRVSTASQPSETKRQPRSVGPEASSRKGKKVQAPVEPELSIASALTEIPRSCRQAKSLITRTPQIFTRSTGPIARSVTSLIQRSRRSSRFRSSLQHQKTGLSERSSRRGCSI